MFGSIIPFYSPERRLEHEFHCRLRLEHRKQIQMLPVLEGNCLPVEARRITRTPFVGLACAEGGGRQGRGWRGEEAGRACSRSRKHIDLSCISIRRGIVCVVLFFGWG